MDKTVADANGGGREAGVAVFTNWLYFLLCSNKVTHGLQTLRALLLTDHGLAFTRMP